ncbi:transporter substrate-binding domain-containing protein [Lonepinella koalarum]|uniref:Polar amino acid transport system substrate-binding protein n=1 Tax=Lonepinella koalarum TaxID=53417 RepID=A0A4R1KJR2_9PAST|nr:transporter substrate-binding domain-containing protein [Lonepinella koalarum]TCK64984.1 polar amino acid transport system substrate-binding protein [Lonepinella koalarum]
MMKKFAFIVLASLLSLTACGDKQDNTTSTQAAKPQITIATSAAPKPFTYVDQNNQLVGYDIEVVKAIFDKIGKYDIRFEATEFPSVLSGLDSGRYDVGANNFGMNEVRKAKYIYTDPIFKNKYAIVVRPERDDITNFEQLRGKSTELTPGLNYATALEVYNESLPDNKVILEYSEADLASILQRVESGKYDFQLLDKAMGEQFIKEHGFKLKALPVPDDEVSKIGTPFSYLLVSKTEKGQALTEEINQALKVLITEGKLSEISKKYFNDDFAPKQ